jgi:hypothetical protein
MKRITVFDIFLTCFFVFLIIILLYFYFGKNDNGKSYLYIQSGKSEYYYSLEQDKILEIKGIHGVTKIKIEKGKFSFIESPCPNKECIKCGKISIAGIPVVCLPNRVSAYIVAEKKEVEFDGVSK